ncbi:PREDICTED: NACHT, LRR and PYD domains-containing protein 4 [Elephantulus edwardii]|uniref:NACHT, LRR and PYD domains-containing protein 4 n=1 Tax=Elephantulus edwardii TaxID=28737 RepID=UPI0003F0AC58|nr:PREDICTED: NACHT, LRR and PYD domains-containing protein 4 [Elephantulus edwardii]
MESSFFSDFGLMWYLEELQKEEFKQFKAFLKHDSLQPGLRQIPWAEVKKATREELVNLLTKHYGEQQAWDVTLTIFDKISRKDLCEKAKTERSEGTLYQEKFSYVFYFCCQEVKHLAVTSLSELISRGWPGSPAPLGEILSQPRKLLFLIDSLEKLTGTSNELWSDTCSDCVQQQPVQVILTSLMRKKMLPESSVLVATTPEYLQKAEPQLENPEIKPIIGLSEDGKRLYFSCTFQNKNQALEAHNVVKGNKWLYSMCQIPALCWVACTCLKQEVERGRDITLTCHRSTFLFSSFILNTFTSLNAVRPHRKDYLQLEGLCSLAVEGMWTDTFEFSKEDLKRNGLAEGDIPTFLDTKILQKCWAYENCYAFMHKYIQELLAAMFYLLKRPSDHPNPAIKCVEDKGFVKEALDCFQEVHLSVTDRLDLIVSAYCLKQSSCLRKLAVSIEDILNEEKDNRAILAGCYIREPFWESVCDVVRKSQQLLYLDLSMNTLKADDLELLCEALRHSDCCVQSLCLGQCSITADGCQYIASVLTSKPNMKNLEIGHNKIQDEGVKLLCDALANPRCQLESIKLNECHLTSGCCEDLASVLTRSKTLKRLNLTENTLDHAGVVVLCEALKDPNCILTVLEAAVEPDTRGRRDRMDGSWPSASLGLLQTRTLIRPVMSSSPGGLPHTLGLAIVGRRPIP